MLKDPSTTLTKNLMENKFFLWEKIKNTYHAYAHVHH